MPLLRISNFIHYFVTLLPTSLRFRSLLEHSAHFRSLHLHHPFRPNLAKIIPIVLVIWRFTNVSYPIRDCSLSLYKRDQFEIHHQFIEIFWFVVLPLFTKIGSFGGYLDPMRTRDLDHRKRWKIREMIKIRWLKKFLLCYFFSLW